MKDRNKLKWEKFKKWLSSDDFNVVLYLLRSSWYTLRIVWYFICLGFSTYYVITKWDTLSLVNFYYGITLESVIFLMWVGFIIIPFIKKIDIFGVKVETSTESHSFNFEVPEKIDDIITDENKIGNELKDKMKNLEKRK